MDDEDLLNLSIEAAALVDFVSLQHYEADGEPSAIDHQISGICAGLSEATPEQREFFRSSLNRRQRTVLARYGHRTATQALHERSGDLLRGGLIAIALATTGSDDDFRDVMIGIALHHHVARELGLTPSRVFDEAAAYAEPAVNELLRSFGRRTDITLVAFGWREIQTAHGPRFIPAGH
ncbi:MAG: hypothetical protein JWN52_2258 [Actinomycetia bacterium]|jgi:hypothetical protein|nr:hypothetical protein [Actinomycetes bacterium]